MRRAALWIALAACASGGPSQPSRQAETNTAIASPPRGAETLGVEWRSIETPAGTILVAISRPSGPGPFPALVVFHGTHGFAREYVQLAKEVSQAGVIGVAACWFAPGEGRGKRDISPLPCPGKAPRISGHQSEEARRTIDAIIEAVRAFPGVRSDQIAIFGHSRGGGAAWNYALQGGKTQALILNSAGYPDELINKAAELDAPVLILHGDNDTIGPMTDVRRARLFEGALRRAGKSVEAVYYEGGEHNSLFAKPSQHADEIERMKAFLRQRFSP